MGPCDTATSTSPIATQPPSLLAGGCETQPSDPDRLSADRNLIASVQPQYTNKEQDTAAAPPDSRRITRSQATSLRPTIARHLTQQSVDSSTSHDSVFSDQLLSGESSQTDASTPLHTPEQSGQNTRTATPRRLVAHLTSSSPLSSPPVDLFDPYGNSNPPTDTTTDATTDASTHEDSDCSETSESDDTQQSSDFFSSQASNSNLRNLKGRDLFDCNIWADPLKTSVFYRFATTLRQRVKEVEPTVTHRFIAQMRDVGKLARVYTQNIDEIEKKIGLSTDLKHGLGNKKRKSMKQQPAEPSAKEETSERPGHTIAPGTTDSVQASQATEDMTSTTQPKPRPSLSPDRGVECVFLHGSLHSLRCFVCGKLCDWDEAGRESRTLSGEQPECPHCAGATAARQERGKRALGIGKLRPDIVLYGEEHPQSDLISPIVQHDLAAGPDLLLVLGTSLRVHGLKVMVKEFAKAAHNKGGKVVFVNFTKPSESAWGDVLDYWIEWDCDAWVEDLKTRKPLLWLSPDERLELDRQKRETLAEKKKEALKKRESILERKRDSIGDKRQALSEQAKDRPPPKNPVAMRNDYQCGAYVVWDIFQTLAKIGNRPFDNLGYAPRPSCLSAPTSGSAPSDAVCIQEPAADPKTHRRPQKRNRKSLPAKAVAQGQSPHSQLGTPDLTQASSGPANSNSVGGIPTPDSALEDPKPQHQPITTTNVNEPFTKKKKARKSAPAALATHTRTNQKRKLGDEQKRPEKNSGKDMYLQAARELAKSRKTRTGQPPISNRLPSTPANPSPLLRTPNPDTGFGPSPNPFIEPVGADPGRRRYSTSAYTLYSFQPRLLPPLPDPPTPQYGPPAHHTIPNPATNSEFSQGPMLPPLHVNWEQSPPSRITPMEIAPLVGPASPLTDRRPSLNKVQFSYAWHHSTQPIYNDALVGISHQATNTTTTANTTTTTAGTTTTTHKPPRHPESNDDNSPSPSDQLRMEAATQLWQLRGRAQG